MERGIVLGVLVEALQQQQQQQQEEQEQQQQQQEEEQQQQQRGISKDMLWAGMEVAPPSLPPSLILLCDGG